MKKEEKKPIEANISFADASLISFSYIEINKELFVFLDSWDEKTIELHFSSVIYLSYKPGSFISDIYQQYSNSIQEALEREYVIIPTNHSYKLITIEDIDDVPVLEIICNEFSIKNITEHEK